MATLTKAESAWIKKLERLLSNPPSDRIGIYTIGDPDLSVYDKSRDDEIHALLDAGSPEDFCAAVDQLDAQLGSIKTAMPIHSVAG